VGLALLAGHANANTTEDIANTAGTGNAGLLKDGSATGELWACVLPYLVAAWGWGINRLLSSWNFCCVPHRQ
jgi:hypothetical protein